MRLGSGRGNTEIAKGHGYRGSFSASNRTTFRRALRCWNRRGRNVPPGKSTPVRGHPYPASLEIAMKSKASPAARRHTSATNKKNVNGNGNGNGHRDGHRNDGARADGNGDGAATTKAAAARAGRRLEDLDGQPTIAEILGATRAKNTLDRTKLLQTLIAFKKGDFSVRMPGDVEGLDGKIADALNDVIEQNQRMSDELARLSRMVGKEGKMTQRISIGEVTGGWKDSANSVNALISDLVHPVSETARVIGAVAKGDLSQTMALEIEGRPLAGEFLRTARTVNTMVDQLGSFASEVTRVAREVGSEGKLGGQAKVKGVAGTWKDLTDSVNGMAGNLTAQVRNIAAVTTAVARGDLSKKITVDVKGEILELKNTINTMVDQLRSFASEVTRVAREVGTEGKLG